MIDLIITPYINIFGFKLYYYGLVYALGFLAAYIYFRYQSKTKKIDLTFDQVDTLMIYAIIGGILGGRIGEFLFYQFNVLITNPLQIFMIRDGGMSIHGGILGFLIAMWLFLKKYKKITLYEITDNAVIVASFTLFFGRIANFINAELCGRLTTSKIGVNLHNPPTCDGYRHPSQLYEALKNLLMGTILMFVETIERKTNKYKAGYKTWLFVFIYGILRTVVNIWRDDVLWIFGIFGTGQILSIIMAIAAGYILITKYWFKKSKK